MLASRVLAKGRTDNVSVGIMLSNTPVPVEAGCFITGTDIEIAGLETCATDFFEYKYLLIFPLLMLSSGTFMRTLSAFLHA